MNTHRLHRKSQTREFFAHHMLLHVAEFQICEAEASQLGRFNKCLAAMVMASLAIEALVNAVGSRVVNDLSTFERLTPLEKLDTLVEELHINRDATNEPWTTIRFLAGFRNDIAHPKPELIEKVQVLPELALAKLQFDTPLSTLEREITVGNARRSHTAVYQLKRLLSDTLPEDKRFGIDIDTWSESTEYLE